MEEQPESEARRLQESLLSLIDESLAAKNTSEMATLAGYAQAAAVELKDFLQDALDAGTLADGRHEALESAIGALSQAAIEAEKVAFGTDLTSMRGRVQDFKVAAVDANRRLHEALSW